MRNEELKMQIAEFFIHFAFSIFHLSIYICRLVALGRRRWPAIAGFRGRIYDDSTLVPAKRRAVQRGWSPSLFPGPACRVRPHVQRFAPADVGSGGPQSQPAAKLLYGPLVCRRRRQDRFENHGGGPRID